MNWKSATLILLLTVFALNGARQDKRIEEIRRIYKETNERIAAASKNFRESDVVTNELVINKSGTNFPAVGNRREVVTFYYAYREDAVYPDVLLKIISDAEFGLQTVHAEMFFNRSGNLIFYFIKEKDMENSGKNFIEKRVYFADGKAIRFLIGDKPANLDNQSIREDVAMFLEKQKKLVNIFKNSIEEQIN